MCGEDEEQHLHVAVHGADRGDLVSAVGSDAPAQPADHRALVLTVQAEGVVVLGAGLRLGPTRNTHILTGDIHKIPN